MPAAAGTTATTIAGATAIGTGGSPARQDIAGIIGKVGSKRRRHRSVRRRRRFKLHPFARSVTRKPNRQNPRRSVCNRSVQKREHRQKTRPMYRDAALPCAQSWPLMQSPELDDRHGSEVMMAALMTRAGVIVTFNERLPKELILLFRLPTKRHDDLPRDAC